MPSEDHHSHQWRKIEDETDPDDEMEDERDE